MVLSLEELGPASLNGTHQGPADTATAAAKAAAQPVADLGPALQPAPAPNGQPLINSQSTTSFVGQREGQQGQPGDVGCAP